MPLLVPDRLSALDSAFLTIENGPLHMHVGAVAVFEGNGLVRSDGGLDFATLRSTLAHSIASIPRFRQHVRMFPGLGSVWSPDPHFRLDYHVRHTAIPRPGTTEQLYALAGRLFSQRLDRERPLWEMWLVEGLEGGRFAIISKAHHAMLDGVAAMGLLGALFSLEPSALPAREPAPSSPFAEPSTLDFVEALLRHRLERLDAARVRARDFLGAGLRERGSRAVHGIGELLESALRPSATTPLNPPRIGPHRAFAGARLALDDVREARRELGGTLNDIALTIVTGALRRHLERRGVEPLTVGELRALVPVNLRARGAAARPGNQVAMVLAHLPVGEADVLQRLEQIRRHTERLKSASHEVEAVTLVEELSELGPESLVAATFQAALHFLPFHLVVTNVPGPPVPLYLGPAKLEALYPMVPLFARQSLGIALASYDGGLFVGVNADPDAVPDLKELVADLELAKEELFALSRSRRDLKRP